MVNTKVKTAIVNRTQQELVLRVGNNSCFAKLATIADGSQYNLEIDIHGTYQEFSLEPATAGHVLKKMIFTSDDCCDSESMALIISEGVKTGQVLAGHELVGPEKTYHSSRKATRLTAMIAFSDPDHFCQTIPCDYCGRNWPHLSIDTLGGEY